MRTAILLSAVSLISTITAQPCDDQTANIGLTYSGNTIFVQALTDPPAIGHKWTFGDGTEQFGPEAVHTYPGPGTYTVCLAAWWWNNTTQDTCWVEVCEQVNIGGDPCEGFAAAFTTTTTPNGTFFSNATMGSGSQTTYSWSFGDGTFSTEMQPFHTYAPGTYQACLEVVTIRQLPQGVVQTCVDTACQTIVVGGGDPCLGLQVAMTYDIGPGNTVLFIGTTSPNADGFVWYFGDGAEGYDMTVQHTYPGPGTYEVCFAAYRWNEQTQDSCWTEACETITLGNTDPCDGFEAAFTTTTTPNGVQFLNGTVGIGFQTNYAWTFGDGATSNEPSPFHTYTPGTYQACLQVLTILEQSGGGVHTCVDTMCMTIVVPGGDPCLGFEATMGFNIGAGNTVFFSGTTNLPADGYVWYFGDGTQGYAMTEQHTYPGPGTYEACFSAYRWNELTQDSCWTEACATIIINGGDPCDQLQACFVPTQGGPTVFFNNCTSSGSNAQFVWEFGDGTTSGEIAPTHTYQAPGIYTVCLTAYWQNCVDSTCTTITVVQEDPCLDLAPGFQWMSGPDEITFLNNTTGTGFQTDWYWDFGDGGTSNDAQPTHLFPGVGTYTVCLTVISIYQTSAGPVTCSSETCGQVVIQGGDPCDALEACFVPNDLGNSLFFFDNCSSQNGNAQFFWDFGDGSTSTNMHGEHVYPLPGSYDVCLIVQEGNCTDSTCVVIDVGTPCNSLLTVFDWTVSGAVAQFTNLTVPVGLSTTWSWTFGDGTTSTQTDPVHQYNSPGTYQVCLTSTSILEGGFTCTDTQCSTVLVGGGQACDPNFAVELAWNVGANNVVFLNGTSNLPNTYFVWELGDGSEAYGPSVTHTYAQAGSYIVCLSGWYYNEATGDSCWTEECAHIFTDGIGEICQELEAGFQWMNGSNEIAFVNSTTGTGFQTNWSWDFGDGGTSDEAQPTHLFPGPGNYTVCLLVVSYYETPNGPVTCTSEACGQVVIQGADPCDTLDACFVSNDLGNNAYFFDNCSAGPLGTQYLWDFGDGSTSTVQHAEHVYSAPGTYTVCLTASWENCTDSTCTTVTVGNAGGCAGFEVWFEAQYQDVAILFIAHPSMPANGILWTFGDGTSGFGTTVVHTFQPGGPYEVCVQAWYWNEAEQDSCWSTSCQWVEPFFPTGITPYSTDAFRTYPVPAHGALTMDGPSDLQGAVVRLFGMDGRQSVKKRVDAWPFVLDLTDVAPAVYILELSADGTRYRSRIVVE
ncbi:MAG: PKD domain-containing protein [Flavobacteriales bacterium]